MVQGDSLCGVVWCGMVVCGGVWCGVVWYRTLRVNQSLELLKKKEGDLGA